MAPSSINRSFGSAYPISSFTCSLVYKGQSSQAKSKALVNCLWWAVHEGRNCRRDKLRTLACGHSSQGRGKDQIYKPMRASPLILPGSEVEAHLPRRR
jgi:hypothetical protein